MGWEVWPMKRTVELELIHRALAALEERRPDEGERSTLAIRRYLDAERLERELALLRRRPVAAAHASELGEPGAFLRRELYGVPALLTRDEEGRVQGFLNSCRHRGTQLVDAEAGCARRFSCPYHGWTYGLDGSLKGVPHAGGFPGLDRADLGLHTLPTCEAHGLIWVVPTASEEAIDVDDWLGPLSADLAGLHLGELVPYAPEVRRWAANWKLLAEGGLETYHFRQTHAESIFPLFPDNLFVADVFGAHIRSVILKRSLAELRSQPEEAWRLREHANVLYSLFPTTVLLVQDEHVEWIHWAPTAVNETVVHITPLVPPPQDAAAEAYWARHRALTVSTLAEDFEIAASIQRGMHFRPTGQVHLGTFEYLLGQFNQTLETELEMGC